MSKDTQDKGNKDYYNKDAGINKSGEKKGKYIEREDRNNRKDRGTRREEREVRPSDRRRDTRSRDNREKEKEKYQKDLEEKRVKGLRDRRRAVQKQMNKAKNSDDPLNEIDWSDKNLKSRDRRKLREVIENRDLDDISKKDIKKKESEGLKGRIKSNKKESKKETAKMVGGTAAALGTGGMSLILSIPSLIKSAYKKRKLEKDTKKTKRQVYMQRFMFVLPTLLIFMGFLFMSFFIFMEVANITSIALSHPEGIKELYEAGVLGDAMNVGNVTEDVVVDGEVIVKGNPEAQPGCFEWNGVWYCGGCLTTEGEGGLTASDNNNNFMQGDGKSMGKMVLPINYPYKTTSDTGLRNLGLGTKPHGGMDLVPLNNIDIMAVDGGKVVKSVSQYAPNSGYYGSKDGGGWGNHVIIEHSGEDYKRTVYAHLNSVDVKEGDSVSQGQVLGKMGHTGSSTGAHLHLEVWTGTTSSTRTEPRDYLKLAPDGVTWKEEGS